MDVKDIEEFFNHYKNSINTIIKLESRLLKESYSYRKWSVSLREKSRTIRKLYVKNEELRNKIITNIESKADNITYEIAEAYITHIDFFTSEGYRDYGMITPVINILLPFYEKQGDIERIFDCSFFIAIEYMAYKDFGRAELYFNKAIALYDSISDNKAYYKIYRMMCSYYFRMVSRAYDIADGRNDSIYQMKFFDYVKCTIRIWCDECPLDFITDVKKKALCDIIDSLVQFVVNRLIEDGVRPLDEIIEYIKCKYNEKTDNNEEVGDREYVVYNKILCYEGIISEDEYRQVISDRYTQYMHRNFENTYRNNKRWDIISLFDDEVKEDEFDAKNLYYMSDDFEAIFYLLAEKVSMTEDEEEQRKIFGYISYHLGKLPYVNGDFTMDYVIENGMTKMFRNVKNVDIILEVIENFYVYRQTVTVIHSAMVSRLAAVITEKLVDNRSEFFVGIFGTKDDHEVRDRREEFITYAEIAGKCHDVGKISCTDIITLQSRRIVDEEFEMIKSHPARGAEMLHQIEALKEYADIALGHHKWHNGKRGYPMEFDNTSSKYRIFIDIVRICDCIDAATDMLGRNYTRSKDFYQVLDEFVRDKDEMYSSDVVEYICEDKELIRKIYEMTLTDREMACYEVYQNFIERGIDFIPMNEKYVRGCKNSDVDALAGMNNISEEEQVVLMRKCEGLSYLVQDGHGCMYGSVFAYYISNDIIRIENISIPDKYRRCGNGTMLMDFLEKKAKEMGITCICVDSHLNNHDDKFFWVRGYSYGDDETYLEKRL